MKRLSREGRVAEGLGILRASLRRHQFDGADVARAGQIIAKAMCGGAIDERPLRVLVLGQLTTSRLVPSLTAVAWGHGSAALIKDGGYDTILQDLSSLPAGDEAPDVVVLLPWSERLLGGAEAPSTLIEAELDFWRRAWDLSIGRLGARVLQVGYDWVAPGPLGYSLAGRADGPIALIDQINAALLQQLPRGAYFLDLRQVSGTVGRLAFYDMRQYYWTKQPFAENGLFRLTEHLWAGIRALMVGPNKVVVLDLDNTLWGGVVGETGPLGVALGDSPEGEAFRRFQKYLKGLADRGIVLAIASKNNPADALEVFEKNPDMILRIDDFGAYEISWDPKGTTIGRLAATLNLGLDSFVFVDDNPAEREQVRQALPEVQVVELPEDPAEYARALQEGLYFETIGLTDEDRVRTSQYVVERKRRNLETSATSVDDYLRSLEMYGEVRTIDEADLSRVEQLLSKTNQFNLSTRRHTREVVRELLAAPNSVGVTLRLRDRFGDHGLVAVMIVVPAGDPPTSVATIDTWLMSCRVIGRTAEHFLLRAVLERCRKLGYQYVIGEYIQTKKNALVATLYESLGFKPRGMQTDSSSTFFEFSLDESELASTLIHDESPNEAENEPARSRTQVIGAR